MKDLIQFLLDNNVAFDYRANTESKSIRVSYDDYCMYLIEISSILIKEETLDDFLTACNINNQISFVFTI